MKQKSLEVFIAGPAGRLEAKYFKNKKKMHPHGFYKFNNNGTTKYTKAR